MVPCSGSSVELHYWERWSAEQPPLPMVYLPIGWSMHFWRRWHEGIEELAPRQAIKNIDWVRCTLTLTLTLTPVVLTLSP